ncbi:MAG: LytTR family transcriptional regulator [Bacteroidales bacterium]|nr:LytTR family transcriptional regulator [Bacteroidales bacterium]
MQSSQITRIMLPSEDGFSFYDIDKIVRCEKEGNSTKIYFNDCTEPISIEHTIWEIEEMISGSFLYTVNCKNIINLNYIKRYSNNDGGCIVLKDGSRITISQYRLKQLVEKLKEIVRVC